MNTEPTAQQLIGAVLRRRRELLGFSVIGAAGVVEVSKRSLEGHERGEVAAIPIERYCPVYGMTVREVLAQAAVIEVRSQPSR